MQCPHCQSEFEKKPHVFALGDDQDGTWQVSNNRCPTCDRLIISLCTKDGCTYPAWPASTTRARLSQDVPADFAGEYHAASQIIFYSPEASAAISRRLLHRFLASHAQAGRGGLAEQIRQASVSPEVPAYLREALLTLARVAKLDPDGAKSLQPEALAPAEPGEADWLLDVLQSLFEFYFVQPARMQRRQSALEERSGPPAAPEAPAAAEAVEAPEPPAPSAAEQPV